MTTASLTEVRDRLAEVVNDALAGQETVITRNGKPVAIVLGYDEYEGLVETLNILSDDDTMAAIRDADAEFGEAGV
ncbi:MAG: Prevent-host-death protein putative antitoxin of system [Naasia sp.]|nr:Prevent-host-death protein putative antitoxin of system [Naasia sp.]